MNHLIRSITTTIVFCGGLVAIRVDPDCDDSVKNILDMQPAFPTAAIISFCFCIAFPSSILEAMWSESRLYCGLAGMLGATGFSIINEEPITKFPVRIFGGYSLGVGGVGISSLLPGSLVSLFGDRKFSITNALYIAANSILATGGLKLCIPNLPIGKKLIGQMLVCISAYMLVPQSFRDLNPFFKLGVHQN